MPIKLLILAVVIYIVFRSVLKIGDSSKNNKANKKNNTSNDDDIIDADYTVIDDDK